MTRVHLGPRPPPAWSTLLCAAASGLGAFLKEDSVRLQCREAFRSYGLAEPVIDVTHGWCQLYLGDVRVACRREDLPAACVVLLCELVPDAHVELVACAATELAAGRVRKP